MNAIVSNSMAKKNYAQAVDVAIIRGLITVAVKIEGDAKLLAPVDTGRLAGSITYATKKKASGVESPATHSDGVSTPRNKWMAYVGTNVEYAADVEYGTRPHSINGPVKIRGVGWRYIKKHPGTKKQSFLRAAIDNNRHGALRDFKAEIHGGLKRGK